MFKWNLLQLWRLYSRKKPSEATQIAHNFLSDLSTANRWPWNYDGNIFFGKMYSIFRLVCIFMVTTQSTFYDAFDSFYAVNSADHFCYQILCGNFWIVLADILPVFIGIDFFFSAFGFTVFAVIIFFSNCNKISGFYVTLDRIRLWSVWKFIVVL